MTLRDEGKVIIEVSMNEFVAKAENPNIPYTWEEVAVDAVACAEAGGSIVHYHPRYASGEQARIGDDGHIDEQVYRSAMEEIAKSADVITIPTAFTLPGDITLVNQLSHQWALLDDPPAGGSMPFGVFDGFRIGPMPVVAKDGTLRFRAADGGNEGEPYQLPEVMRVMIERGLVPSIVLFDLSEARWVRMVAQAGLLPQPVFVLSIFMKNHSLTPSPTTQSIDAYISELTMDGGIDGEFGVSVYSISDLDHYERIIRHCLDRRLNFRVGIGDCPQAIPGATNAELVQWAVKLCREYGCEPATPDDVRTRLNLS